MIRSFKADDIRAFLVSIFEIMFNDNIYHFLLKLDPITKDIPHMVQIWQHVS